MVKSVAQGPKAVRIGPADVEVSKFPLARSPNYYAMIGDRGATLCNRSDTRVSKSGRAPDAQKPGSDAAYANPSLSRIIIS